MPTTMGICEGEIDSAGTITYGNCLYQQAVCTRIQIRWQTDWLSNSITGYEDCDDAVATIIRLHLKFVTVDSSCDHPLNPESDIAGIYTGVIGECLSSGYVWI